jgi:hypothetical protein
MTHGPIATRRVAHDAAGGAGHGAAVEYSANLGWLYALNDEHAG